MMAGEGEVITGVVKRIKRPEGFGFISCSDGRERFFHRSSVKDGDFDRMVENKTNVRGTIAPGKVKDGVQKDQRLEGVFII